MPKIKTPDDSLTVMTEIVMPNDTNSLNHLMGGNLLRWMDIAGAICARRHAHVSCVTASVDNVSFDLPILLGELVTITAKATRVFNSSMEIYIEVHSEGTMANNHRKCNQAFFTFVGIDENNKIVKLPPLEPKTESEHQAHQSALRRRHYRLILADRMEPAQSDVLRAMFLK